MKRIQLTIANKGKRNMKKLLSTAVIMGIITSTSLLPVSYAGVDAGALPVKYNNGADNTNVAIDPDYTNKEMTITVLGGRNGVGTAHWEKFDVGEDATVNIDFTNHHQTSLNYVRGTDYSQIYGKIQDRTSLNPTYNPNCLSGCDYSSTGKVILINPNGAFFGSGANVNLNSFTVATGMNGSYDNNNLTLTKNKNLSTDTSIKRTNPETGVEEDLGHSIIVEDGATIYGNKGVAFASGENAILYHGSQISTNTTNNNHPKADADARAFGKVKLVTADGVNFKYDIYGTPNKVENIASTADKMVINLQGNIKSGNIEVVNGSTHADAQINANKASLWAVKATNGSDGTIELTANNKAIIANSELKTTNNTGAENREGGSIKITSIKGTTLDNVNTDGTTGTGTKVNAVGDVTLIATGSNGNVAVDASTVNTTGKFTINSSNKASIQKGSSVTAGGDVEIVAVNGAYVKDASSVSGKNVDLTTSADYIWFDRANITATDKISAEAGTGTILSQDSTGANGKSTLNAPEIELKSNSADIIGVYDLTNNKTTINAGKDINVSLVNAGNSQKGLIAEAGKNVQIQTTGDLAVSRLVAKDGDMVLTANKIITGAPLNNITGEGDEVKFAGDTDDRALISVRYGTFTSNEYEKTQSGGDEFVGTDGKFVGEDGVTYQVKHNIQYNNGADKVLLINPQAKVAEPEPQPEPEPIVEEESVNVNDNIASMLNKIPRQPEAYSNATSISDGRTSFVDVFAAASQIEIDDDNSY